MSFKIQDFLDKGFVQHKTAEEFWFKLNMEMYNE